MSEWFSGANLYSDFALENHGFFHPAYVACSSYFLTQAAMHYTYARRPIPQAATHHLLDVWRMFQGILLPQGEPAYPQGMDWELHGITVINLFASLATYQRDPLAARLEQHCLQYMRAWQAMEHGNLAVPGSRLGFTRHAICAEQAAYGFLAHKLFGPAPKEINARKAASEVTGVYALDSVGVITHRTENKLVCFSWKNRVGGMLIPIGERHEGQPYFTVPIPNGLIGSFDLVPPANKQMEVVDHGWRATTNGFETTGTLLIANGKLRHELKVTSIGERTVVYQDRVTALADVSISTERGVPLGIENDKLTGGLRMVFGHAGKTAFEFGKHQAPVALAGTWANVDGRLGVTAIAGSGMRYVQASGYHPGMAVAADVLYASATDQAKQFKAGETVARRVVVFFIEVDAKKTAKLAESVTTSSRSGSQMLRFKLPEGGEAEVAFMGGAVLPKPAELSHPAAGSPKASAGGKPLARIEWDASTLSLIQTNGGYARIIRLQDGAWLCGFDFRRSIWVRRSQDEGKTWQAPVRVAEWPFGGLTNTELLQLRDGSLLCCYNERPCRGQTNQPFAIALARSDDGGKTWRKSERLYAGGAEFGNGCWEPAAIELPSGEVQVFFSNESPYRHSDEQEITLVRSQDGARTWSAPETVSFRARHRDGMAVPLVLKDSRGIAFAIEDNGPSGNFKPVIVFSTLEDNWRSGMRCPGNPNRWSALPTLPAPPVAASAPYLRQMPSGETLLSFQQTDQTGEMKTAYMVVCIGDAQARHFCSPSNPFPVAEQKAQLWNSLFVKNSHTVVAVSQTTINGISGIWSIEGSFIRK